MTSTHHPLLGRRPARTGPTVTLIEGQDGMGLAAGRTHEGCGPARHTLALWLAARMQRDIVWVGTDWAQDRLHMDGVSAWVDPGRFIFVAAKRAEDVLWTLEEALRSGAAPLVVGDLPAPPGLTQVRRMHLAAETGGKEGPHVPLGLLLTPDMGGAQGVESRWHLAPGHHTAPGLWRLSRLRARTAPEATWTITRPKTGAALNIKAA